MPQKSPQKNQIAKRPPVIAVMGHIDHGKSTLLDYLRKTNVVDKEAGGITQHVSAYEVSHAMPEGSEFKATFLDTPGHAAFSGIRERGAEIADIAILVVSAEDGVKPQTLEALQAIRKQELPFLVAMNKIDKPTANAERTKANLAENNIFLEGYGGDIPGVQISAKTGQGIPELLDVLGLLADLQELSGDRGKPAEGFVLESNLDPRKGITATLIVKDGSIGRGQFISAGGAIAPVRIMENFLGKPITEASFSSPVRIIGWDKLPPVGATFRAFESKDGALQDAADAASSAAKAGSKDRKEETGQAESSIAVIPVIVKADAQGSLEAAAGEIGKLSTEKVTLRVIHSGIGAISENDLKSAQSAARPVIIGFNVKPDATARNFALRNDLPIHEFDVIYKLTEWLQGVVTERTPKELVEETTGSAKVLKCFSAVKDRQVLGGRVESGMLKSGQEVKIVRRQTEVGRGKIRELQQNKLKAGSVEEGSEFGAMIESTLPISPGDHLEAFEQIEK